MTEVVFLANQSSKFAETLSFLLELSSFFLSFFHLEFFFKMSNLEACQASNLDPFSATRTNEFAETLSFLLDFLVLWLKF